MGISLKVSELVSRAERSKIGTRFIKSIDTVVKDPKKEGGIIGFILGGLSSLAGWIWNGVKAFFQFDWSKLWSKVTSGIQALWNFNWNATDKQLEASIKSRWNALKVRAAGALGNAFGYLTCGILPGAVIFAFNEPLGAYVLKNVGEELLDEITDNFGALLNDALTLGMQIFLTETYKNARKLIKKSSPWIAKHFGDQNAAIVRAWGSEGSKPWSFASAETQFLEDNIKDEGDREAVEEFLEESREACVEAGYVVANSVDMWNAQDLLRRETTPILGRERYVEITPNRDIPDEKIVLAGREEVLKPMIIQTLTNYEQMRQKDIGIVYGTLASEIPNRRHRPEVVLKFYRKQNNNPSKGAITKAASMQISFRLMDRTHRDFASEDKYPKVLAEAIKREFATPLVDIKIGQKTYTYADHEKGYQFKLDVVSADEAKRIISKVLDIQGHKFNKDLFRQGSKQSNELNTNDGSVPEKEKYTILGKTITVEEKKREGEVTFVQAYVNVGVAGVPPIDLIDVRGKRNGLVYV